MSSWPDPEYTVIKSVYEMMNSEYVGICLIENHKKEMKYLQAIPSQSSFPGTIFHVILVITVGDYFSHDYDWCYCVRLTH